MAMKFVTAEMTIRHLKQRLITTVLVLSTLVAWLAFSPPSHAGEEVTIDGVLHVKNGNTGSEGVEILNLQEQWRIGGDDDEVFFGVISRVMADDDGNVYLLDSQLSEVQVFSPAGEYLRTLSREGDGPGEVRNPNDMIFMPDGSLGLVQQFPGKIIKVDMEGNPAGEFTPGNLDPTSGGFIALADAKSGGGNLVLGGVNITMDTSVGAQDRNCYVASFAEDGSEQTRYQELNYRWEFPDVVLDEWEMLFIWRRWVVDQQGRVLIPPVRDQYLINVYRPDGSLERVIERDFTSFERGDDTPSVTQTIMEAIQRQVQRQGLPQATTNIEKTEPDVGSIHLGEDGSIWVLNSRGIRNQPEGIMVTYDVFDSDGHFRKEVQIACEGDGVRDGLFFLPQNRVILVTGFVDAVLAQMGGGDAELDEGAEEPMPMEIVCFSIQ
jgi:hypothetical protein